MIKYKNIKKRIYEILEVAGDEDRESRCFDYFILFLILFNILAVILESVNFLSEKYNYYFKIFEFISVLVFSIEYILRIWSCNINEKYNHPIWGRIKFALTPLLIIDLLAISPFFLPAIFVMDLRILRAIRLIRLLRIVKITRYNSSIEILIKVLKSRKDQLVVSFSFILILLILLSTFVYFFENPFQPDIFSNIPVTIYWGIMTMTTVGYGDMYPVTIWGKFFASLISLLCIGVFAIPSGIISSAFIEVMENQRKQKNSSLKLTCPHCGKELTQVLDKENIKIY